MSPFPEDGLPGAFRKEAAGRAGARGPGETDEQFEDLCSFVEEGLFDYVGVFPYSREEGTRAFDLPGQLWIPP